MNIDLRIFCFSGLLVLGGMSACKSGKNLEGAKAHGSVKKLEAVYATLIKTETYQWYSGKARLRASTPDLRVSATVNLRMVRDSVIWATIDKFGFEIARALITPDSVFVVDRLNREFTREALDVFMDEFGVRISFADLQNTLTGGVINVAAVRLQCSREEDCNVFVVEDGAGILGKHWVSGDEPPRLLKSYFKDTGGRTLELENSRWGTVDDTHVLPFGRYLAFVDNDGRTEVELTFSSISLDQPASLPFSIPVNYANAR